jgi:(1->4)-alpha-D-glucan 1-alpha-D-glucosylmutase
MHDVDQWVTAHLLQPGLSNSLAQKLLQLTMPGVPDVYQGQELFDLSLVDPDNRRPVDFAGRRAALAADPTDPAVDPKLVVTRSALRLRGQRPAAFTGYYSPVGATGSAADHVLAFRRGEDVIAVVTRLPVGLARSGGWRDTRLDLPAGDWTDVITGATATAEVATVLDRLPVALLARASR